MNNITFVIFTYNEEKRISYVIRNFIKYGEVFIMDDGSTDRTKEISEELGAKVFLRPKTGKAYVENQETFDFVKSKVKTGYIYWGFADNIAPKILVEKFIELANQNIYKKINGASYSYLWGNVKNYAVRFYGTVIFHKDFFDFTDNCIHSTGKFIGTDNQIFSLPNNEKYALHHFSTYNISKFVPAHLRYAEAEAMQRFEAGEKFSVKKMLVDMAKTFFTWGKFIKRRSVLVLIIPFNYVFFRLMMYTKLFELENNITIDSIEKNYSEVKEKMLKEL